MTRNSAWKRAAREYMKQHPGITLHEAMREVKIIHEEQRDWDPFDDVMTIQELLEVAAKDDEQLLGVELSIDSLGSAFDVDLGPEIEEGPVTVTGVQIDTSTLSFDVHESYAGGLSIGEAHVTAIVTYSVCVYKPTYYGAPDDVSWLVIDADWNDDYILAAGEFTSELVYHFTIVEGENRTEGLELVELIQLDKDSDTRRFGAART